MKEVIGRVLIFSKTDKLLLSELHLQIWLIQHAKIYHLTWITHWYSSVFLNGRIITNTTVVEKNIQAYIQRVANINNYRLIFCSLLFYMSHEPLFKDERSTNRKRNIICICANNTVCEETYLLPDKDIQTCFLTHCFCHKLCTQADTQLSGFISLSTVNICYCLLICLLYCILICLKQNMRLKVCGACYVSFKENVRNQGGRREWCVYMYTNLEIPVTASSALKLIRNCGSSTDYSWFCSQVIFHTYFLVNELISNAIHSTLPLKVVWVDSPCLGLLVCFVKSSRKHRWYWTVCERKGVTKTFSGDVMVEEIRHCISIWISEEVQIECGIRGVLAERWYGYVQK